jgi:ferredoxin--NADP+ reductase
MSDQLNAIVTQRIEVAPGLIILRVSPDGWDLPGFEAGQFAVLGLPQSAPRALMSDAEEATDAPDRLIRRAYSIASSSLEKSYLEFYVTLVHSGRLTPRLFALQAGDRVHLGRKFSGTFTLDQVPEGSDLVLVATGTGLAPYMSMLRSEITCHLEARTTVVLGARHTWDLGYRGELTAMQRFCPTFHYIPVVSRPDEELTRWHGHTGYVQDVWERGLIGDLGTATGSFAVPCAAVRRPAHDREHAGRPGRLGLPRAHEGCAGTDPRREVLVGAPGPHGA